MQIRERGSKIEFLRAEYNPARKRSTQRMIGSQDRYDSRLTPDLAGKMTEKEVAQAEAWFKEKQDAHEERDRSFTVRYAGSRLSEIARSIEVRPDLLSPKIAEETYTGLDLVAKALRKAGYKKTARGNLPATSGEN